VESRTCKLFMGVTLSETGGAQKVVYHLLEALPADRYDITLACAPGGELIDWVTELNRRRPRPIHLVTLPSLRREISPWADLGTLFALVRLLRRERFDVAHLHSSKMGILGRLAAWWAGVPKVIFTVHGWGVNEHQAAWKRWVFGRVEKAVARLTTRIACVSEYDLRVGQARGLVPSGKGLVIYNGVPEAEAKPGALRDQLGLPSETCVIGMVGRLAEAKHPELVLHSAHALKLRGCTRFHLVLIGDGPLRGVSQRLISELGLAPFVTLLGTRDDARLLMSDLDILLLLSRYEGFPLVVLEAMQAGVPVVATPVGGVPEQVVSGETGLLVAADPAIVAEQLDELIQRPGLRMAMGEAGKRRSAHFAVQAMVQAYERLYTTDNTAP